MWFPQDSLYCLSNPFKNLFDAGGQTRTSALADVLLIPNVNREYASAKLVSFQVLNFRYWLEFGSNLMWS